MDGRMQRGFHHGLPGQPQAREVVEAVLAQVVGNRTEAAYARSDLFKRRRRLMDDWSAYPGGCALPSSWWTAWVR